MVNLGQKLKMPKTSEKPSHKIIRVLLCKKPLEQTSNIREMRKFWKSAILQRLYPLQNGQFRSKIKNAKIMRKRILHYDKSCSVQKTALKKHQIFEKWDNFENRPSCKGYNPCKGYSICKMVSLGQKLKMPKPCEKPSYKIIRVLFCKKKS